MSRTVGLIVEYNPMHNGHVYHLEASKKITEADTSVAVMSGHFLQRGEPAMLSKWARAEMALAMGVDLVLELPVSYAVGPAEWFAHGAVATLHHTGVVDSLCFGSESGELAPLAAMADLLASEPKALSEAIQRQLQQGASYPAAYAAAAAELAPGGDAAGALALLKQPNNTLGLHYMIALEAAQQRDPALHGAAYRRRLSRCDAGTRQHRQCHGRAPAAPRRRTRSSGPLRAGCNACHSAARMAGRTRSGSPGALQGCLACPAGDL